MSRQTWRFDSLGVHRVIELGRVLINEHQSKRWGSVCFTPESGREASLLKESALCQDRSLKRLRVRRGRCSFVASNVGYGDQERWISSRSSGAPEVPQPRKKPSKIFISPIGSLQQVTRTRNHGTTPRSRPPLGNGFAQRSFVATLFHVCTLQFSADP
jgi:hypothetical protein